MFQQSDLKKKVKNESEEFLVKRIQEYFDDKKYLILTGEEYKIAKRLIRRKILAEKAFEENFVLEGGRSLILFPNVNPFPHAKNES